MKKDDLLSISPLDGRYSNLCKDISLIFSEYNLIKQRVHVEIEWFKFLLKQMILTRYLQYQRKMRVY